MTKLTETDVKRFHELNRPSLVPPMKISMFRLNHTKQFKETIFLKNSLLMNYGITIPKAWDLTSAVKNRCRKYYKNEIHADFKPDRPYVV